MTTETRSRGGAPQATAVRYGAIAVKHGFVSDHHVKDALDAQQFLKGQGIEKKIGEILVETDVMTTEQSGAVVEEQGRLKRNIGRRLGSFEILAKLGEGSFGVVYKARQTNLDRMVALKVIRSRFTRDPRFMERFHAEARALAALNHPNIVSCFDAGEAEGRHYLVMEYVDGGSAWYAVRDGGPIPEERALNIAIHINRALIHAHEKGFVHRDVKPGNVLLTSGGQAKLADLGMASLRSGQTDGTVTAGTPNYMAPEQIESARPVDARADIYGLGATLYLMVTGRRLFGKGTVPELMAKHLAAEAPWPRDINPELSPLACGLIRKMTARAPEDRFQTAMELIEAIERVLKQLPFKGVLAAEVPSSVAAPKKTRRRRSELSARANKKVRSDERPPGRAASRRDRAAGSDASRRAVTTDSQKDSPMGEENVFYWACRKCGTNLKCCATSRRALEAACTNCKHVNLIPATRTVVAYNLWRKAEKARAKQRVKTSSKKESPDVAPAAAAPAPRLVDAATGEEYPIDRNPFTFGRHDENDLSIAHSSVSRQHAMIYRKGSDFFLEDFAPTNGTFVGDARVEGPIKLSDGDLIHIKLPPDAGVEGWKAVFRLTSEA